jgi:integrase
MRNDAGTVKKYKYYKGSFTIGKKPNGSPERVYVRGKTKRERDEKLAEAKRLHGIGVILGTTTVSEWAERWMYVYKANASDTQRDHYDAKLRYDILPAIGYMRMREVRASHLQELLNRYRGGKKGTVSKIRIALKQLFADAEVERLIERNPAGRLELPILTEDTRRPLTTEERAAVLKVAATHQRGAYILTMLFCGLRRGECIALERGDVDLENRRLIVNKALNLNKNVGRITGTKATNMRKKKIKSDENFSARIVPIPDVLMPAMEALCEEKTGRGILFPKADGKYATKQTCHWWWRSFARQCHIESDAKLYRNAVQHKTSKFGQEVTPHYLRHTYATDLYAAGLDEKARKAFMGHSSNDVTDIYTKMNENAFLRASTLLNEYHNSSIALGETLE